MKYGVREAGPVLQAVRHAPGVLSFPELFELFFVKQFVALGVPLQHVRDAAEALSQQVGDFPFTRNELFAMGKHIVALIGDALVEPASGQRVMRYEDVGRLIADFAEEMRNKVEMADGVVVRCYPEPDRGIFLDKRIRSGEPVAGEHAVPTRAIYKLWKVEGDLTSVMEYFDLPEETVSAAIRFEGEIELAA